MSYSAAIKSELSQRIPRGRHCQLAEIASFIQFAGVVTLTGDEKWSVIITENETVKGKYFTLLEKAFKIEADITKVIKALAICDESGHLRSPHEGVSLLLLKNICCRRAYLRAVFISTGTMSDPRSGYHLEFVLDYAEQAAQLTKILAGFTLEAKTAKRKKRIVVYIKEGAVIVDLLNIMGAHQALLQLETLRVEKEVRNFVNRQVNCEAANISRTITAAARQIEDIVYLKENGGFAALPDNVRQLAEIRLLYPDLSLAELGGMCDPPLGKSGVNHRLRKINEFRNILLHQYQTEERND
ncbi:MAG: DNA-binding protein WhiA [Lachnospiraceae bacterium]|jgi:DNA-binding protein WhiA|nr:DNA-binding protein WhiA [Lachnospiraceae bacterium]